MEEIYWPGDENELKATLFTDLRPSQRVIFSRVHQLPSGCKILRFLDQNPRSRLCADDVAFQTCEPEPIVEETLQGLSDLGLVQKSEIGGLVFFGLVLDQIERVHELYSWQERWHARITRIEHLLSGSSPE